MSILIWLNTKTICSISIRCHCIVAKFELKFFGAKTWLRTRMFGSADAGYSLRLVYSLSMKTLHAIARRSGNVRNVSTNEFRYGRPQYTRVHVLTETDIVVVVIVIHKREHQRWQHQATAAAAKGRRGSHRHLVHELCWHFSYFYRTVHTNHRR